MLNLSSLTAYDSFRGTKVSEKKEKLSQINKNSLINDTEKSGFWVLLIQINMSDEKIRSRTNN